jgi:hypothetical protein
MATESPLLELELELEAVSGVDTGTGAGAGVGVGVCDGATVGVATGAAAGVDAGSLDDELLDVEPVDDDGSEDDEGALLAETTGDEALEELALLVDSEMIGTEENGELDNDNDDDNDDAP